MDAVCHASAKNKLNVYCLKMKISVMSLNLRYDKPDLGNHAWAIRKDAVGSLITDHASDIIGTQEGKAHQILDLHRLLPDYQSVGYDRTGKGIDEYCAIFYRPARLRCLASGDFCLSETPEIAGSMSADWGNSLPRMVSWAVFAVADVAQKLTVFNTHLDYKSARARELGMRLICDRLKSLDITQSYVLLTGDFNAAPGTPPRDALKQSLANQLLLQDALLNVELQEQLSFHDFTGKAFAAVDTIYYDSRLSLGNVKVETGQWQDIFPSDHFPVIADFESP